MQHSPGTSVGPATTDSRPGPRTAAPSAADRAYTLVRGRIVSGTTPGGTMLSEGEVADELGTSRTPVREAFLRLQAEGWMQLYPKRGALVRPVEADELAELVEARLLVESAAVRSVADDAARASALVKTLRAHVDTQQHAAAAGDLDAFTLADVAFHQAVADAGGNSILVAFYASLRDRQHRITARTVRAGGDRVATILEQHVALADHVAARDAAAFEQALGAHLGQIRGGVLGR